jgi:hopanoid biosynthesis associated RND transporter like protein HpnN
MPANPVTRLVAIACRRPLAMLGIALLLSLLSLAFISQRFAMTTDTSALISPDVPWRVAERRMEAAFPQNGDSIVAVIDGATPELAEAAAAALAGRLASDRAHFRRVTRPDGGDFFAREGLLFGSEADASAATARMIEAQPFLGPLAADPSLRGAASTLGTMAQGVARGEARLAQIDRPMAALADALEAQAAGRPAFFSWQALFGDDKGGPLSAPRRRLVLATPVLDYQALMPGADAADAMRAAATALKLDATHGVTVRLTGSSPLSDEEFASLVDKAWLVAGTMIAAMLLTLRLATRSWRIVGAILATTIAGLAITTALGLAAVGRLNLISVAFIPLFVGLGVDFGIQIGVRFQAERLDGSGPADAMAATAQALAGPLLLAAGAVCLGFLAFLPTAYVGIAELGVIAGIGMIVALGLSVTLLPALLMLMPPGRPRAEIGSPRLAPLDGFLLRRRGLVLGLFALSMVASIASLAFVRFDFDPLHLRNPRGEAMATLADLMRDPDRNPNTIEILAPDLKAARALAPRLAALPAVGRVLSIDSFVPDDQAPKLATIGDAQALLELTLDPFAPAAPPADVETVAALRTTASALDVAAQGSTAPAARRLAAAFRHLADASPAQREQAQAMLVPPLVTMLGQMRQALAAEPVTLATLPADLKRDWIAPDGQVRIEISPRAGTTGNAALARFVAAVRTVDPQATGLAVSTQAAAHTVGQAFVQAGLLALAAVSLLLFLVLRDVREVAFTLAPVVLSGFLTLGTCVLIGQPINFANIIAFPLLFGVGTAFHIYFVMAWRAGATNLLQSPLARAIFFSALATGAAFGSLWLSSHPGTASMGKILMISLAWTLVCALIFEPALLGAPISRRRADPAA